MLHKEFFEVGLQNVEFRSAGKRVQSEQEEHPSVTHDLSGRLNTGSERAQPTEEERSTVAHDLLGEGDDLTRRGGRVA